MTLEEIRDVSFHPLYIEGQADIQGLDLPSIVSHKWAIHSCSAVTGAGLDGGMDWMIKEVAGRLYWSDSNSSTTSIPGLPTISNLPTATTA